MPGLLKAARLAVIIGAVFSFSSLHGCAKPDQDLVHGYVEGEFIYVSSPLPGRLDKLEVRRGDQVNSDQLLFELENTTEQAARDEAERKLAQARAMLEDLRKSRRPSEIQSLEAQLAQARAALEFSEREVTRWESASRADATSVREVDRARSRRDQDKQLVAQLEADVETARLGSREDQIIAAEANVAALQAALNSAEWDLGQKQQSAPNAGLVFDTVFREGEWVGAGRPVVVILPPSNVKVRAFVPQARLGSLKVGQSVDVSVDGVAVRYAGNVAFVSPEAEYTPPVIYSQEGRAKMVFMIEIEFDSDIAAKLHPGQPVDVHFGDGR